MNEHDFAVWLNGWVELNGGKMPDAAQWKMIVDHLNLVFKKVTPPLMPAPNLNVDWQKIIRQDNTIPAVGPSTIDTSIGYPLPYIGDVPSRNNIFC